jgi:hypothetical protein
MEAVKRDFMIFSAFLLSHGVRVAADVIKDYSDDSEVFLTMDDLDHIAKVVESDAGFKKLNDNFIQYLKYLILSERDPQKLNNLKTLSDTLTKGGLNTFAFSMN